MEKILIRFTGVDSSGHNVFISRKGNYFKNVESAHYPQHLFNSNSFNGEPDCPISLEKFQIVSSFIKSLHNDSVNFDNGDKLSYQESITNNIPYYKIQLNGIDVTQQYFLFLQSKKVTKPSWRYSKLTNQFSVGFNSSHAIFGPLSDDQLIEFRRLITLK